MADKAQVTVAGFLFWLLAAKRFQANDLGIGSAEAAVLVLLSMIARWGFDFTFLADLPRASRERVASLVGTGLAICSGAGLAIGAIFVLGTPLWSPDLGILRNTALLPLFAVVTAVWTASTLMEPLFIGVGQPSLVFAKNFLVSLTRISLLFLLPASLGATGLLLSIGVAMLLGAGVVFVFWRVWGARQTAPLRIDFAPFRETARASAANYVVALLLTIPLGVGSVMTLNRFGTEAAARFYILWLFGSIGMIAPFVFGQTLLVKLSKDPTHSRQLMVRALAVTVATGVAILIVGLVAMPFFGRQYASLGLAALFPFALATIPGFLFQAEMARLRVIGLRMALMGGAALSVITFLAGVGLLSAGPEDSGWWWLASLSIGWIVCWIGRAASHKSPGDEQAQAVAPTYEP